MALMCMVIDFKHTKPWLCEFCGELALADGVRVGVRAGVAAAAGKRSDVMYGWEGVVRD